VLLLSTKHQTVLNIQRKENYERKLQIERMNTETVEFANYNVLLRRAAINFLRAAADLNDIRESIARQHPAPEISLGAFGSVPFTRSNTDELIAETFNDSSDHAAGQNQRSHSESVEGAQRKRRKLCDRYFRFRLQKLYETATWHSDGSATFLVSKIRELNSDLSSPESSMRKRMKNHNFSIRTASRDSWVVKHEELDETNWQQALFNV
jgi:hypothetical protein